MFNVNKKSLLKAVMQSVRGGETARGTTVPLKEQRAVKDKAKGPGKSCSPRGRRGRCSNRTCPLAFCLRQPDVEPDDCGFDEVAPHGKVSFGDCDDGQGMSGRLQPGERLSDCQGSSCPAPPPSPIHRSRQQRLPVMPGGHFTQPEEQSLTPELPLDEGGSREEVSDVPVTDKKSSRLSLRTKLRGFFKSLWNQRGQVRSQQSKALDYVVSDCTERDLSDNVSMESITIGTEISHYRPKPTIETRKVAWKASSKGKSKSSKEWDRWRAVESSYAGRYSSKVAPLPCPLDDDDHAEQRPTLYRSNIKTSTRVSAFDIEGALADPRVRRINSTSSGPSSSGCQPNGNARASSSRPLYRNQASSATHPIMAASWAITDWTTHRGEGPENQKPPQQEQEQEGTIDKNVLAFMSYHKYRSLSNMAVSSAMSINPSSHSADDVDGGRRNTNSAGQRKTNRIIHVKPLFPKPTESS